MRIAGLWHELMTGTDAGLPVVRPDPATLSDEERAWFDAVDRWRSAEGGYRAIQRTKPQTLAYALSDSPVGMAAWIVEKLRAWSDCGGDLERSFTFEEPELYAGDVREFFAAYR